MSPFTQSFPFGSLPPVAYNVDLVLQKTYPGIIRLGSETNAKWVEDREIAGDWWLFKDAMYNGSQFLPTNPITSVQAFAIKYAANGSWQWYSSAMAAGVIVSPITWNLLASVDGTGNATFNNLTVNGTLTGPGVTSVNTTNISGTSGITITAPATGQLVGVNISGASLLATVTSTDGSISVSRTGQTVNLSASGGGGATALGSLTNSISVPTAKLTEFSGTSLIATASKALLGISQYTFPTTAANFRGVCEFVIDELNASYGTGLQVTTPASLPPGPYVLRNTAVNGLPDPCQCGDGTGAQFGRFSDQFAGGSTIGLAQWLSSAATAPTGNRSKAVMLAFPLDTGSRQCGYASTPMPATAVGSSGGGAAPATPQTMMTSPTLVLPNGVGSLTYRVFVRLQNFGGAASNLLAIGGTAGTASRGDTGGSAITGGLAQGTTATNGLAVEYSAIYNQGSNLSFTALAGTAGVAYGSMIMDILAIPVSDYGSSVVTYNLTTGAGLTISTPQTVATVTATAPSLVANYLVRATHFNNGGQQNKLGLSVTAGAPLNGTSTGRQPFPFGTSVATNSGTAAINSYIDTYSTSDPRGRLYWVVPSGTIVTVNALSYQSSQAMTGDIELVFYPTT